MTMIRNNFGDLLEPILNEVFFEKYMSYPKEYESCFNVLTSKKKTETDSQVTGFGMFSSKAEGAAIAYDDAYQGYDQTYTHTTYGKGYRITREMMEDEQYPVMKNMSKALARAAAVTIDTLAASVFNNAFTVANGGDGVELCSLVHPLVGGGTEQNELTTPADLTVTSLQEAISYMEDTRDDRNLLLNIKAKKLLVPKELKFVARELLQSPDKPYTGNNEINALREEGLQYLVNHYLVDDDAWFLLADKDETGLKFFWRRNIDHGKANDFDTEDAKFKATFRISYGFSDWRGVFGSPGI